MPPVRRRQYPVEGVRVVLITASMRTQRRGTKPLRAWLPLGTRFLLTLLVLAGVALLAIGCAPDANPTEESSTGVVSIVNKGSDTLVNLALAWAERYMELNPGYRISVTGGGSGTGITGLINGTVDIANASRDMSVEEIDALRSSGMEPVEYTVAGDAIAVVVNPSNPVDRLTLSQIADIYTGKITNWSEVGGEDRPIVLLSRESNSGTYVFFLENVIRVGGGDDTLLFSPDTLLMPSSEGISEEVRQNPNAIGYDGLGYVTPDQKTIAIATEEGEPYVMPSIETVNEGTYPISRALYMYTAGEPSGPVREYLDWILTDGQALVAGVGFVPLQPAAEGSR